jgi:sugar fermentation stimulation protein A
MDFQQKLVPGKLIRRYKRFLSDVVLENGELVVAHCTNSGSMKTCIEEGAPVYLSPASDPKRKTRYTWEIIFINKNWVGINTNNANKIALEAIRNGEIKKLKGYNLLKPEVKYHDSRFDIYAENDSEKCFIEVKNVSMKIDEFARFPDAVTTRGKKHLQTLVKAKEEGYRAVMLYIIQRMDINFFGPAWEIDEEYSEALVKAYKKGVEIIPVRVHVSPDSIKISKEIKFDLTRY